MLQQSTQAKRWCRIAQVGDVVYHWWTGRVAVVEKMWPDKTWIFLSFPAGGPARWRRRVAFVVLALPDYSQPPKCRSCGAQLVKKMGQSLAAAAPAEGEKKEKIDVFCVRNVDPGPASRAIKAKAATQTVVKRGFPTEEVFCGEELGSSIFVPRALFTDHELFNSKTGVLLIC